LQGIVALNDGDVMQALPSILTVFLLAGVMQIGLGFLGLGKYIKYIPYPVVSGFMTAIGVIILITQIMPSIGYYPKEDLDYVNQFKPQAEEIILDNILKEEAGEGLLVLENFEETIKRAKTITQAQIQQEAATLAGSDSSGVLGALRVLPRGLKNINWLELILSLCTIIIIFGFKRITTVIPSTLVALLTVSGVAYFAGLNYEPISQIPSGFPKPNWNIFTNFELGSIAPYIFTALTLALLGAIDSLLTSVVADNMTKTQHNPNKELVGQGIGNAVGAFFGGLPGAGATIRTVVNINSGGKTRISGMIAGVLLLIIMVSLGPVASKIPAAVLAGILITVGISVMDYKGLKAIPNIPKPEVAIMLIVLVLSSVWNLVYAVGIGLVIASLMFMKKIGDLTSEKSDIKSLNEEPWGDEFAFPENLKEEVFIKHIHGPLFFGTTSDFVALSNQLPDTAQAIIIRMDKTSYIDQSGLYALEDVIVPLVNQGKKILLVGLQKQPKYMMERVNMIPTLLPKDCLFNNIDECLVYIKENVEDIYSES